jgi:uncharacterized protein YdiU (UPF0061 family)
MTGFASLQFENRYARMHPAFYQVVDPTPLPDPYLVAFNPDAAGLLELDPARLDPDAIVQYLSGNRRIPGSEPIAQAYAGHQFGVWVPQLGDGRAFLLGQVVNGKGERWDLHLKGAGRTRFSRFGDGRSVLRSAIREYLACEALHGLGIPTTRALGIVGSDFPVQRERVETAATLLRLAPSHVRFGTFEFFASRGESERVGELLNHVLSQHVPDLAAGRSDGKMAAVAFFREVCERTARLMAQWVAAGFAHGVMNTDNMSVLGITLDYGPYGFLDEYDAGFICNHTDAEGRYAFGRQPAVGLWNCARLGEALMVMDPAVTADPAHPAATEPWQQALESYWPAFHQEYARLMRAKLGFATERDEDAEIIRELLGVLQAEGADYTGFFRELCWFDATAGRPVGQTASDSRRAWLSRYGDRLRAEASGDCERRERMQRVNPRYVLRNWIAQEAIEAAERKEFGPIEEVRRLLRDPYAEHPGMERFAEPPRGAARDLVVSCSS